MRNGIVIVCLARLSLTQAISVITSSWYNSGVDVQIYYFITCFHSNMHILHFTVVCIMHVILLRHVSIATCIYILHFTVVYIIHVILLWHVSMCIHSSIPMYVVQLCNIMRHVSIAICICIQFSFHVGNSIVMLFVYVSIATCTAIYTNF